MSNKGQGKELIIPGSIGIAIVGYGLVEVNGGACAPRTSCIVLQHTKPAATRLAAIYDNLNKVIKANNPQVMAIEEIVFI